MSVVTGPDIIKDGLLIYVDAANSKSYTGVNDTWYDLSGKNNHGTLNTLVKNSNNQGVIDFDTDNTVDFGTDSSLFPDSITQEVYIKPNVLGSHNGVVSNLPSWGTGFGIQIGTAQGIAAQVSGAYLNAGVVPSLNTWYHIIATYDITTELSSIYVDGRLENSFTRTVLYTTTPYLRLGVFYTNGSTIRFSGDLAMYRLYNKALTASEVKQNFEATRSRFNI